LSKHDDLADYLTNDPFLEDARRPHDERSSTAAVESTT
jgi:hypothetical protein